MKNNLIFFHFFLMAVFFLVPSCSDDNDRPDHIFDPGSIEGSWIRYHPVTDVPIRITFYADGSFLWEPRVDTGYHTPSTGNYSFENEELSLFDDDDCPGITGVYHAVLQENTLVVTDIEDECDPRIPGMQGVWVAEQDVEQ